jgi:hypothetical protein
VVGGEDGARARRPQAPLEVEEKVLTNSIDTSIDAANTTSLPPSSRSMRRGRVYPRGFAAAVRRIGV